MTRIAHSAAALVLCLGTHAHQAGAWKCGSFRADASGSSSGTDSRFMCSHPDHRRGEARGGEFRCLDGSCIYVNSLCNHVCDCDDESDEQNCEQPGDINGCWTTIQDPRGNAFLIEDNKLIVNNKVLQSLVMISNNKFTTANHRDEQHGSVVEVVGGQLHWGNGDVWIAASVGSCTTAQSTTSAIPTTKTSSTTAAASVNTSTTVILTTSTSPTTTMNGNFIPMPSLAETLACAQVGVGWDPMDMIGHQVTIEDNVSACLFRCRKIAGCAHFTFFSQFSNCHVANSFATPQPGRLGSISGPAGCASGAGAHMDTVNTMLLQKHCFHNGISYLPWFNSGHELEGTTSELVKDVLDCETRCEHRSWCKKFEYDVFTHLCHLMQTWPKGRPLPGDQLISGPPQCPGHIAFNVTIQNVDFATLNEHPDLIRLLKDAITNATVRNPDNYNASEFDEELVHLSSGSMSTLHHYYTAEHSKLRHQLGPYNTSVVASVAVYAARGISFAIAKLATTSRFKVAGDVTHSLKLLQSRFVPVMPSDSDLFVSAVSPITAFGHKQLATISRATVAHESVRNALQNILTKDGAGGDRAAATTLLLMALAVCISSSVAVWRRGERSRQGYHPLQTHI